MIDTVATTYHCSFEEAARLDVYEFLNVYSYSIAKNKYENDLQKVAYDKLKAKYKR